jgi:hypothetical protein
MKTTNSEEIDVIKDKYTKKVGIFTKIKMNFNDFKESLNKNKSFKEDKEFIKSTLIDVIIYGICGVLVSTLVGMSISFINFLAFGFGFWIFEKKILMFISKILSSIKLVEVRA